MYIDLALNNLQELICPEIQPTNLKAEICLLSF